LLHQPPHHAGAPGAGVFDWRLAAFLLDGDGHRQVADLRTDWGLVGRWLAAATGTARTATGTTGAAAPATEPPAV